VAADLTRRLPGPCSVYYQKHMTHHMLPEVDLDFTDRLINCFLVRDPARMIVSYARVRPELTLEDLGLPQQWRIFEHVRARTEARPLVLDAMDVLADPRRELGRLCAHAGVAFHEEMLAWPAGPRDSDGVWARHWYAAVEKSTGFQPPPRDSVEVPAGYAQVHAEAERIYDRIVGG
jgi:hypothetical protein